MRVAEHRNSGSDAEVGPVLWFLPNLMMSHPVLNMFKVHGFVLPMICSIDSICPNMAL